MFDPLEARNTPKNSFKLSLFMASYEILKQVSISKVTLRPDFTLNLVYGLAFGTHKFYIAPYGEINYGLVNLSFNCDVKSGPEVIKLFSCSTQLCMKF